MFPVLRAADGAERCARLAGARESSACSGEHVGEQSPHVCAPLLVQLQSGLLAARAEHEHLGFEGPEPQQPLESGLGFQPADSARFRARGRGDGTAARNAFLWITLRPIQAEQHQDEKLKTTQKKLNTCKAILQIHKATFQ